MYFQIRAVTSVGQASKPISVYAFICLENMEIGIGQRIKLLRVVLKYLSFEGTRTQLSKKKVFIESPQERLGHAGP